MMSDKPNCYECLHRRSLPGSRHSGCDNRNANAKGDPRGIRSGWFSWPYNFDPAWLVSCDGFKSKTPKSDAQLIAEVETEKIVNGVARDAGIEVTDG